MTWLQLDDGILDHPKFIRAVQLGGDSIVFLWLGARAYCGKHLTDGFIPSYMMGEIRGPKDEATRARALEALVQVGLLEQEADGYRMHDYLEWSPSREDVLRRRDAERTRKQVRTDGARSTRSVRTESARNPTGTRSESEEPPDRTAHGTRTASVGPILSDPILSGDPEPDPARAREQPPTATAPDEPEGDNRTTMCPPDITLPDRTLDEFASRYRVTREQLDAAIREFVGFWTLGAGAGERRSRAGWARALRERLRRRGEAGELGSRSPPRSGPRVAPQADPQALRSDGSWMRGVVEVFADGTEVVHE